MSETRVSTGRSRLTFTDLTPVTPPAESEDLPPLCFELHFTADASHLVDLTAFPLSQVSRFLGLAMRRIHELPGGPDSRATADATVSTIRQFVGFLALTGDEEDDAVRELADISDAHVDAYEDWLRARYGETTTPANRMRTLVALLRHLRQVLKVRMHPTMEKRVHFAFHGDPGTSTPRDAYHPKVAEAIRRAARRHIGEVVRRHYEGERMIRAGVDPRDSDEHVKYGGWWNENNLVWEVARAGPLTTKKIVRQAGVHFHIHHPVNTINRRVYPYTEDLLPFLILLALETGIEIECCKTLTTDCLKNAVDGFVTIRFRKRRASKWLEKRVRDGGSTTPGGIIRMVLTITRRSRDRCPSDQLWLTCARGRIAPAKTQFARSDHFIRWVERWSVVDVDGSSLVLHPSRLRKTYKLLHYLRVGGQLEDFSEGLHSLNVAANNYGDIPALRLTHEQTIAEGITAALDASMQPTILLPAEEDELDEMTRAGENDVMLNACLDFTNSPFSKPGTECEAPPWLCLDCSNAAITERHLPNLMRFLDLILEERSVMPEREWWSKWGRYYARVTLQVFPKYSEESLLAAKAAAESGDPLVWIPLDSLTTGYWS